MAATRGHRLFPTAVRDAKRYLTCTDARNRRGGASYYSLVRTWLDTTSLVRAFKDVLERGSRHPDRKSLLARCVRPTNIIRHRARSVGPAQYRATPDQFDSHRRVGPFIALVPDPNNELDLANMHLDVCHGVAADESMYLGRS